MHALVRIANVHAGSRSGMIGREDIDPPELMAAHFAAMAEKMCVVFSSLKAQMDDTSQPIEHSRDLLARMVDLCDEEHRRYFELRRKIREKAEKGTEEATPPSEEQAPSRLLLPSGDPVGPDLLVNNHRKPFSELSDEDKVNRLAGIYNTAMDKVTDLIKLDLRAGAGKKLDALTISISSRASEAIGLTKGKNFDEIFDTLFRQIDEALQFVESETMNG